MNISKYDHNITKNNNSQIKTSDPINIQSEPDADFNQNNINIQNSTCDSEVYRFYMIGFFTSVATALASTTALIITCCCKESAKNIICCCEWCELVKDCCELCVACCEDDDNENTSDEQGNDVELSQVVPEANVYIPNTVLPPINIIINSDAIKKSLGTEI